MTLRDVVGEVNGAASPMWWSALDLGVGDAVQHATRGRGYIVAINASDDGRVHVEFDGAAGGETHRYAERSWHKLKQIQVVASKTARVGASFMELFSAALSSPAAPAARVADTGNPMFRPRAVTEHPHVSVQERVKAMHAEQMDRRRTPHAHRKKKAMQKSLQRGGKGAHGSNASSSGSSSDSSMSSSEESSEDLSSLTDTEDDAEEVARRSPSISIISARV